MYFCTAFTHIIKKYDRVECIVYCFYVILGLFQLYLRHNHANKHQNGVTVVLSWRLYDSTNGKSGFTLKGSDYFPLDRFIRFNSTHIIVYYEFIHGLFYVYIRGMGVDRKVGASFLRGPESGERKLFKWCGKWEGQPSGDDGNVVDMQN